MFLKHSLESLGRGWLVCALLFPRLSQSSDLGNPNRQLENEQYMPLLALIDTPLTVLKRPNDK